jgi:hypothetical protein
MNLNDLLREKNIDPQQVLVIRHRPWESKLNEVLPWLASDKPDVFNAYQQTHAERTEKAITRVGYVASFIRHGPGKALFIGLYSVKGWKSITRAQFWRIPEHIELKSYGMNGLTEDSPRSSILLFDLALTDFYAHWKGKLIVSWPGKELAYYRYAHKPKNEMPILAILEESALDAAMPEWNALDLTWEKLKILPTRWKLVLSQWRAIYYIFDASDGKGYVGSAYGCNNLLGRWQNHAASGHGGNRLLRQRDPKNFHYTILQIVAHDMDEGDVIRLEATWKDRLHTRHPNGLNDN